MFKELVLNMKRSQVFDYIYLFAAHSSRLLPVFAPFVCGCVVCMCQICLSRAR